MTKQDYESVGYAWMRDNRTWYLADCPYPTGSWQRDAWQSGAWRWMHETRLVRGVRS